MLMTKEKNDQALKIIKDIIILAKYAHKNN